LNSLPPAVAVARWPSGTLLAFREPVHTAALDAALALVHRIKSGVGRMFEAQIALTVGLITGLILGWLSAGMQ
jgi:hypothetical protein